VKVAEYIVRFLEAQGVEYVFGYQGGMVTHLVDALSKSQRIKFIPCYHEQNAGFAAEGYARVSGRIGVCIATSGPGAMNTLTSVGNAYFDSVPVLYLMGQVNTYEYKYDSKIRQRGFQETDVVSVARPVSKDAFMVDDPAGVPEALAHAVRIMLSDRRGPVVLDLPMDVQRGEIDAEGPSAIEGDELPELDPSAISRIRRELLGAKRPLVLCGGGIGSGHLKDVVGRFLTHTGFPYVVSLMGKGLVDETSPHFLGMIGSYGNRSANLVLARADVVLVLGSRLDLRQTGNRESSILKGIRFLRVDVDPREIEEGGLPNQLAFVGSAESLLQAIGNDDYPISDSWKRHIETISREHSQSEDVRRHAENRVPYEIMAKISHEADDDAIFVGDVGQNQMWAAQMLSMGPGRRFLTSGGMAPMGYAISAAVGAAFATHGQRQVVCTCGDGGFHLGVQALQLIRQHALPISVVVFNNHALGMITQFQRRYFNGNLAGTTEEGGYLAPNIRGLATAYDLKCVEGLEPMSVWEVDTNGLTSVVPKLEYNRGLDDMTPAF